MNNEDIQLADLLETYPSNMTYGIQSLITGKKEFKELENEVKETLELGRGKYFKHQKFTHRYLRLYNELLVISETGTGKSCEVIGFLEYALKEMTKREKDRRDGDLKVSKYERVIILVSSKTQKEEVTKQIIEKCSDGRYQILINQGNKNPLNNIYDIYTYNRFHKINNNLTEYEINHKYSNTIFWADEAHNLNPHDDNIEDLNGTIVKDKSTKDKSAIYRTILNVFHNSENCKKILSTATPMINSPNDLIPLLNLILPKNGQIPKNFNYQKANDNDIRLYFPKLSNIQNLSPDNIKSMNKKDLEQYFVGQIPNNYDFTDAKNLEEVEPYFRGKVAYIRAPNTGAIIINNKTFGKNFYASIMEDNIQLSSYIMTFNDTGSVYNSQQEASRFVFPSGTYGNDKINTVKIEFNKTISKREEETESKAYKTYVKETGTGHTKVLRATNVDNFDDKLRDFDELKKMSCKYASMIELIQQSTGIVFIYGERIIGSGINVLTLCLDAIGYERYTETKSALIIDENNNKIIDPNFKQRDRYAVLTSSNSNNSELLETIKTYQNRHGAYIKVLIVTQMARDGINVENVTQIHLVGPIWNESSMYQAQSRGIRATSHDVLLNEERDKLIKQEKERLLEEKENSFKDDNELISIIKSNINLENVNIEVNVYRHGAIIDDTKTYIVICGNINNGYIEQLNDHYSVHEEYKKYNIKILLSPINKNNNIIELYILGQDKKLYNTILDNLCSFLNQITNEPFHRYYQGAFDDEGQYMGEKMQNIDYKNNMSSIDERIYNVALYKDKQNKKILRYMKQCAIGCNVNKKKNFRINDLNGSSDCDYQDCDYKCFDELLTHDESSNLNSQLLDFSTYGELYNNELVSELIKKIIQLYRQNSILSLNDIINIIDKIILKKFYILALEKIIIDKIIIIDRYGFINYLSENNGMFYLDRNYPYNISLNKVSSSSMNYYSDNILSLETKNIKDFANVEYNTEDLLKEINTYNIDTDANQEIFDHYLSHNNLIKTSSILEQVILQLELLNNQSPKPSVSVVNLPNPLYLYIKKFYHLWLYKFKNPAVYSYKLNTETKKRRISTETITDFKNNFYDRLDNDNSKSDGYIYINVINNVPERIKGHGIINNLTQAKQYTRILKTSKLSNGWEFINEDNEKEFTIYNIMIQMGNYNRRLPYHNNNLVYGIYLNINLNYESKDKFSIVDGSTPINENPGKTCGTDDDKVLCNILYSLLHYDNYINPDPKYHSNNLLLINSYKEILTRKNFTFNGWSNYRISYYVENIININKTNQCKLIFNKLKEYKCFLNIPNTTTTINQFI